jgi:hypothetical protein
MKTAKPILFMQLILLFFFYQASAQREIISVTVNDTLPNGKIVFRTYDRIPLGDINNDKIPDTAYIDKPSTRSYKSDSDCEANRFCRVIIFFSCDTPEPWPIFFDSAVAAELENIGDIDGDGWSELIAVPQRIDSCRGFYHFYSMKNGRWKEIGYVQHNTCGAASYRNCIKKIKDNTITAVEQIPEGGDVVEKIKIIEVK